MPFLIKKSLIFMQLQHNSISIIAFPKLDNSKADIYLHILAKQLKSSTLPELSNVSVSFCSRLQCQVVGAVIHVISVIYPELAVYTTGIILSLISYLYPCFIQWKFPHTWINTNSNLLSFLLTCNCLILNNCSSKVSSFCYMYHTLILCEIMYILC